MKNTELLFSWGLIYVAKSIFQFTENWQISALSYLAITTVMNLIAYTKRRNKWSQKHSIQLWFGENNIFSLSWHQTQSENLDSCCTWALYSLAAHALQILNAWENTSKCCQQLLFPEIRTLVIRKIISYNERWKVKNVVLYFITAYTGDQDQFIPTTEGKISSFSLKAQCIEVFQSSCPVRTG